jgi:hypothetical protein
VGVPRHMAALLVGSLVLFGDRADGDFTGAILRNFGCKLVKRQLQTAAATGYSGPGTPTQASLGEI